MLLNFQLNDAFLITLLLIGQPELGERIRNLPQLDDRLSARGLLRPLERRDGHAVLISTTAWPSPDVSTRRSRREPSN